MSTSIKQLVDRGLEICFELERLQAELKQIEKSLGSKSLWKDHKPLVDGDREGRRYLAVGTLRTVPVVFTADKIVGQFQHDSPLHARITAVACGKLDQFFTLQQVYKNNFDDGKKFRAKASQLLDRSAPEFITACRAVDKDGIPKSDIKITWDDAAENAKAEA